MRTQQTDPMLRQVAGVAGGFDGWFSGRGRMVRVVLGLVAWPVVVGAKLARRGSTAAVATGLFVAVVVGLLWVLFLATPMLDVPADDAVDDRTTASAAGTADTEDDTAEDDATDSADDGDGTAASPDASDTPETGADPGADPGGDPEPSSVASGDTLVADLLAELDTASERRDGYDRDLFDHWVDADGDGCNAREETLIDESTVTATTGPGCSVTGRWYSHFDGVWVDDASELDVDHLVPLAEAWDSGAYRWDEETRRAFANDLDEPRALIAVTASANRSKADRDPAGWLPPDDGYHCVYVADWVVIKHRWQLAVDTAERAAIEEIIAGCGQLTADAADAVDPGTAPPTEPEPEPDDPADDPPSDAGDSGDGGGEPRTFANCDELRQVYPDGVAREDADGNVVSGQLRGFSGSPVFDTELYEANTGRDGDGDGIACE